MRSTTQLAIVWVLAVPFMGGGAVQPEPGVNPKDAPAMLAPAICDQGDRCCTMDQLMKNGNAGTDAASCESRTQTARTGQVSAIESSERKGRVNYDGVKVQPCIDYPYDANTECADLNMTFHFSGVPPLLVVPRAQGGGRRRVHCDAMAMTCAMPPTTLAAAGTCFYSSGCNHTGTESGVGAILGLAILIVSTGIRRRTHAKESARTRLILRRHARKSDCESSLAAAPSPGSFT
jgi:hypothetical protein